MTQLVTNGEIALALGALEANAGLVIGCPDIPGAKAIEYIQLKAYIHPIEVQWISNGAFALEEAVGASMVGVRTLIGIDYLGLGEGVAALGPLLAHYVHGGLVILLGASRENSAPAEPTSTFMLKKLPMLEPASPTEGQEMILQAFRLSEQFELPIILRINPDYCRLTENISAPGLPLANDLQSGNIEELFKQHPDPGWMHNNLVEITRHLSELGQLFELSPFNRIEGDGKVGIVAVGQTYQKLSQVLAQHPTRDFRILKLGTLNPIPEATIAYFLNGHPSVLVLEDNAPIVERRLIQLAKQHGCETQIKGRLTDDIPRDRELYLWQIEEILTALHPALFTPKKASFLPKNETRVLDPCQNCDLLQIRQAIIQTLEENFPENSPLLVEEQLCKIQFSRSHYPVAFINPGSNAGIGLGVGLAKAQAEHRVVVMLDAMNLIRKGTDALVTATQVQTNILLVIFDIQWNKPATATDVDEIYSSSQQKYYQSSFDLENLLQLCNLKLLRVLEAPNPGAWEHDFVQAVNSNEAGIFLFKIPCRRFRQANIMNFE
ncbi:hypothetical protein L0128_19520 [candidate division KSB1 bacterium]|nr:hypothetical protein [candidate division KSB1 bacterium]